MYKSVRELKDAIKKTAYYGDKHRIRAVIDLNEIERYRNPKDKRSFLMRDKRSYKAPITFKDGTTIEMWHVYPIAISDKQVHIVCPHCGYIHHHGNSEDGYEGTRVPHCMGVSADEYMIVRLK